MGKSTHITVDDQFVSTAYPMPITAPNPINVIVTDDVPPATTITEYNVTCTVADTEYSQALPASTLAFEFRNRGSHDTRWSFVTGKVAVPTAPYNTLSGGQVYYQTELSFTTKTLYIASATAGDVVEIVVYT